MPFLLLIASLLAAQFAHRDRLIVTVQEAARSLSVSSSAVYDLVRRGELPFVRVGSRLMIEQHELEAFVAARSKRVRALDAVLNDDDPASTGSTVRTSPADVGDGHEPG